MAAVEEDGRTFVAVKANINLPGNPVRARTANDSGGAHPARWRRRPTAGHDGLDVVDQHSYRRGRGAGRGHLAVPDAQTITIVGCGEQGEAQLRAMSLCAIAQPGVRPRWRHRQGRAIRAAYVCRIGLRIEPVDRSRCGRGRERHVCDVHDVTAAVAVPRASAPGLVRCCGRRRQSSEAGNRRRRDGAHSRVVVDSLAACAAGGDLHHALRAEAMSEQRRPR